MSKLNLISSGFGVIDRIKNHNPNIYESLDKTLSNLNLYTSTNDVYYVFVDNNSHFFSLYDCKLNELDKVYIPNEKDFLFWLENIQLTYDFVITDFELEYLDDEVDLT